MENIDPKRSPSSDRLYELASQIDPLLSDRLQKEEVTTEEENPGFFQQMRLFLSLVLPSITIGISHSGTDLMNSLGFYIADKKGNEVEITAFGLSVYMNIVAMFNLTQPIFEKASISCALAFSAGKNDKMKEACVRGLIVFTFYSLFLFLPVYLVADKVLMFFGTDPAVAIRTREILVTLFPMEFIRLLSEYIIVYMVAQGVDTGYGVLTVSSLLVSAPIGYYLGITRSLGVKGWYIGRLGLELVKISILIVVYCTRIEDKWFKVEHLMAGFTEIKAFMKDVLIFTAGHYCEAVGYEITTFFVIMLHDPKQLAAFTILMNLLYINENIGYGFGVTIRTRINHLFGQKKFHQAKDFFKMSMLGLLMFTPVVGLVYFSCRNLIVDFYTSNNPSLSGYLQTLVLIQGATCFSILFLLPVFMASRSTNQAVLNIKLDVSILIGLQSVSAYCLVNYWHPQCTHLLLLANVCFTLANSLICLKLFLMDWKIECSNMESLEEETFKEKEIISNQEQ